MRKKALKIIKKLGSMEEVQRGAPQLLTQRQILYILVLVILHRK